MDSRALAKQIRIDSLNMIHAAGAAHIGSCLSVADILAVLYADVLHPEDKVIFSKGHAAAAFYSVLARTGHFDPELLKTYCKPGSDLKGCVSHEVPGVLLSTGSLGHGLPVACGMALAIRCSGPRVYCIMSDGEMDAGTSWEAAKFATEHGVNNLSVIVDANGWQGCKKAANLSPFHAAGWPTFSVTSATSLREELDTKWRKAVFMQTPKGKGVSFMEDNNLWHYRCPDKDEYIRALRELEAS